jgi:hypothetical protein
MPTVTAAKLEAMSERLEEEITQAVTEGGLHRFGRLWHPSLIALSFGKSSREGLW